MTVRGSYHSLIIIYWVSIKYYKQGHMLSIVRGEAIGLSLPGVYSVAGERNYDTISVAEV